MNITVEELAKKLNGDIQGDASVLVNHPAKIEEAKNGSICFLANMKYEDFLYSTEASAVIVNKNLNLKQEPKTTLIKVDEAYSSFVQVLNLFNDTIFQFKGVSELAFVHPSANIGENVTIQPYAVINEGATIGDNCYIMQGCSIGAYTTIGHNALLYPNVSIYHYCAIGNNAILHAGVVIGSDGFGFAPENGSYKKIPQVGNVVIGNDVEIGANSTIDRATMGSTIIGNGVKIDNLVQLAHNVVVEDNTVIAALVGVAGSTKIGKNVVIGGQAGFVGHISIADGTKVNAKSGLSKSVTEPNQSLSGNPAVALRDDLKSKAIIRQLPELEKRIQELEKRLNEQ